MIVSKKLCPEWFICITIGELSLKTVNATNKCPEFKAPFSVAFELLNAFSNQVAEVTSSYIRFPQFLSFLYV